MTDLTEIGGRGGGGRGGGGRGGGRGGGGRGGGGFRGGGFRGRGRRGGPRGWSGPGWWPEGDLELLAVEDDWDEGFVEPAPTVTIVPRRRRVLVGEEPKIPPLEAVSALLVRARKALAERKAAAGIFDGVANWLSGADKWGPFEREIAKLEAGGDSPAARVKAASLCRSLGVDVKIPGQSPREAGTDEGDAGVRAEKATISAEIVSSAKEKLDEAKRSPWMPVAVAAVAVVGLAAVAGPVAVAVQARRSGR